MFGITPLFFLFDIKLMDVKLMPFAVRKFGKCNGKNLRFTNYNLRLRRECSVERLRKS